MCATTLRFGRSSCSHCCVDWMLLAASLELEHGEHASTQVTHYGQDGVDVKRLANPCGLLVLRTSTQCKARGCIYIQYYIWLSSIRPYVREPIDPQCVVSERVLNRATSRDSARNK
jgi:hypothetical protein